MVVLGVVNQLLCMNVFYPNTHIWYERYGMGPATRQHCSVTCALREQCIMRCFQLCILVEILHAICMLLMILVF